MTPDAIRAAEDGRLSPQRPMPPEHALFLDGGHVRVAVGRIARSVTTRKLVGVVSDGPGSPSTQCRVD